MKHPVYHNSNLASRLNGPAKLAFLAMYSLAWYNVAIDAEIRAFL